MFRFILFCFLVCFLTLGGTQGSSTPGTISTTRSGGSSVSTNPSVVTTSYEFTNTTSLVSTNATTVTTLPLNTTITTSSTKATTVPSSTNTTLTTLITTVPATTSITNSTTVLPTNHTTISTITTTITAITTALPITTTTSGPKSCHGFDGWSFVGGIILGFVVCIAVFFLIRFLKNRSQGGAPYAPF